jgi:ADP-ribose pyrophosphatase
VVAIGHRAHGHEALLGTDSTTWPDYTPAAWADNPRRRAAMLRPPPAAMGACEGDRGRTKPMNDADSHPSWPRQPWRTTSTRPVYENKWIRVREDVAELPDGRTTVYGVVQCAECVGVLPFLDPDTVVLVGQYRYVARGFYWEMPTGGQHAGETLEEAAQRELAEEAGQVAGRLEKLCDFHTSKSILCEVAHLYLAEDLRPAAAAPDRTEFIERRAFPFAEVLRMVERGEIKDSMTIIAVLHAARRRRL